MISSSGKLSGALILLISLSTRTVDAGECKWTNLRVPGGPWIVCLAIDPVTPQTLYVGTNGAGAFKSTDGGASWSPINSGLAGSTVNPLAIDPATPQTLYAGTDAGLFKSTNGGASWVAINSDQAFSNGVTAIAINPRTPQTLYASGNGLFKSVDGGGTWSAINRGLENSHVGNIAVDPVIPQTVYLVTSGPSQVFKSTDGGGNWNSITGGGPGGGKVLTIDPVTPQTIYTGGYNGGSKSTDGGATWHNYDLGLPDCCTEILTLAIDPRTPQTLYAGTEAGGVFKSTNGGDRWAPINRGLPNEIQVLAVDPGTPQTVYAGTRAGVFKSNDRGGSWDFINSGLPGTTVRALAIDPAMPQTLYAGTGGGVFKSTNGGINWSAMNEGLSSTVVSRLAIDPKTPQTLYIGTEGGAFKSTNGGVSWNAIHVIPYNSSIETLVVDPVTPQTLYASSNGLYKSTNGGASWDELFIMFIGGAIRGVTALAIDPVTPQTLYAGTRFYAGINSIYGAFKSTSGGNGWASMNLSSPNTNIWALAVDPVTSQTVYAGTDKGVFKSTNGGTAWSAMNAGLPSTGVGSMAIDPVTPQTLYAGTWGAVFKSTNGGSSWSSMSAGMPSAISINSLAIDPVTPKKLYAGANGAGAWGYCMCDAPYKPKLTSPSGQTTANPTYSWNAVSGAERYHLWVSDFATNGKIQQWYTAEKVGCASGVGTCSITPSEALAAGAGTWWVQAWNNCDGGSYGPWSDGMTFTVIGGGVPGKATLVSPSGIISTATPTYTWNAVAAATWYQLWVNVGVTTAKIQSWYTAAQAGCSAGSGTCSVTPTIVLSPDSAQWWIQTLNSYGEGPWSDGLAFTVKDMGGVPQITNPIPFSTLTSTVVPFTWTAGTGVDQYWLQVGRTIGGFDIYNQDEKKNLSALVERLPNNGSTIFARLWYYAGNDWRYRDYTYQTCSGCGSILAAITSPAPGSTLTATTVSFKWSAGTGVTQFWLYVGKTPGGSEIYDRDMGTSQTATITNLPNDGSTIYVRLWSKVIGFWAFNDYSFTTIR